MELRGLPHPRITPHLVNPSLTLVRVAAAWEGFLSRQPLGEKNSFSSSQCWKGSCTGQESGWGGGAQGFASLHLLITLCFCFPSQAANPLKAGTASCLCISWFKF